MVSITPTSRQGGAISGGSAALTLKYTVFPWLAVHVGGHVNLVHRRATLTPVQSFNALLSGFVGANPISIEDSASRFAVQPGGEVGLTLNDRSWLTVKIVFEYDSRVPRMIGPNVPVSGAAGTLMQLGFSGQFRYYAVVRATIALQPVF